MTMKTGANTNIDKEDINKIKNILSLRAVMPFQNDRFKKGAHKSLFILTPLLYIFAYLGWRMRNYSLFTTEIVLAVILSGWLIWYYTFRKKTNGRVNRLIEESLKKGKNLQFTEEGISADKIYKYSDIENILIYDEFYFFILKQKDLIIMKMNLERKKQVESILKKHEYIRVTEKSKPFNIYKYIRK